MMRLLMWKIDMKTGIDTIYIPTFKRHDKQIEAKLNNIFKMVRQTESIVFEAMDKDNASDDLIGKSNPLTFNSLTQD